MECPFLPYIMYLCVLRMYSTYFVRRNLERTHRIEDSSRPEGGLKILTYNMGPFPKKDFVRELVENELRRQMLRRTINPLPTPEPSPDEVNAIMSPTDNWVKYVHDSAREICKNYDLVFYQEGPEILFGGDPMATVPTVMINKRYSGIAYNPNKLKVEQVIKCSCRCYNSLSW